MKNAAPQAEQGQDWRLSIVEVAEHLGVSRRTIYNWRHQGYGPPSFKAGALVRYRLKDVLAWEEAQLAKENQ